jgi:hypothetical protein
VTDFFIVEEKIDELRLALKNMMVAIHIQAVCEGRVLIMGER